MNPFTAHCRETDSPQSYWAHGKVSITNSARLIVAGLEGIIHGVFPFWFQFDTANTVIRSFRLLEKSGRHDERIQGSRADV